MSCGTAIAAHGNETCLRSANGMISFAADAAADATGLVIAVSEPFVFDRYQMIHGSSLF